MIKEWLANRRELKRLEKAMDDKIKNEGMYYMFKPKSNVYGYESKGESK